jgi:hypothetical protein
MKKTKRAERRHHSDRVVRRRVSIYTKAWGHDLNRDPGCYRKQGLGCSCCLCKPQKHWHIPTMQERRIMLTMREA